MSKKHPFLFGTFLLTFTAAAARFIGFFYKIFLSRLIGAEGLGIYQMIFPVFGICYSLTAAGVETAVSRCTAAELAAGRKRGAITVLYTGLCISLLTSVCISVLLFRCGPFLALRFLKESRCGILLQLLAFSLPFASCHACIIGYYYGQRQTGIPALSQLAEQLFRVGSVWLLSVRCLRQGITPSPIQAVLGLAVGECAAAACCLLAVTYRLHRDRPIGSSPSMGQCARRILATAIPLSSSRLAVSLLTGTEAVLIPLTLMQNGLSSSEAYGTYGTLTGMALSFILFPNVLIGSAASLLLPTVSEAQTSGDTSGLRRIIRRVFLFCLPFGSLCTLFFLVTGSFLGRFFFQSTLAGNFILILAWICPFLYLNSALNSVLHGLGRTNTAFRNNLIGIAIRLLFILFCIPRQGIRGYLWGLLLNQLCVSLLSVLCLKDYLFCPDK